MSTATSEVVNLAATYQVRRSKNTAGEGIQHVRLDLGSGTAEAQAAGTVPVSVATGFGKTITYVPVDQAGAGTTEIAAASSGNKHKIMGCILVLSVAGTLKFLDGSGDLTGAMSLGDAGGFVLPGSMIPYQQTATNSALSITSTVGAAKGVVMILTEA